LTKSIFAGHISRGRPEQAFKIYNQVMNSSSKNNPITYMLSLDADDPTLATYIELFKFKTAFIVQDNKCYVDAANRLYDQAILHDIVVLPADDLYFPDNWDEEIIKVYNEVGYDKVLKVKYSWGCDDNLLGLITAGSEFFKEFGYLVWPEYTAMFSDNDLTEWSKVHGKYVKAEHLVFPHIHPITFGAVPEELRQKYGGPLEFDETYRKENCKESWDIGKEVFERRKLNNFDNNIK